MMRTTEPTKGAPPDNPMGTAGFEFVEYAAEDVQALKELFHRLGFGAVARHRAKDVTLYRQGDINFIVNAQAEGFARSFARVHGPSVCAMAFRVHDAAWAHRRALGMGAKAGPVSSGPMELNIPAIKGVGDSLIYLVDRYGGRTIYDVDFVPVEGADERPQGIGLNTVDHLTHNVFRGRMDVWAEFYEKLFAFREIRSFEIEGRLKATKTATDEVAVMIDSRDALTVAPLPEGVERHDYVDSWKPTAS